MFLVDVQRRAAGHQNFQAGRCRQQFREHRRSFQQVFKIVEHQQHRRAQRILQIFFNAFELRLTACFAYPQRLRDQKWNHGPFIYGRQRHKINPGGKCEINWRATSTAKRDLPIPPVP